MIGYLFVDKGAPDRLVAKALLLQILDDLAHLPQTVLPQVALPHQVDAAFVLRVFCVVCVTTRERQRCQPVHAQAQLRRRTRTQ